MDERLAVLLISALVMICVATVFVARRQVRIAAVSLPPGALWAEPQADPLAPYVPPAPPEPVITDDATIRNFSSRLAAVEGALPNLKSAIESFESLARRITALETEIPGLADAWERFSDSMDRKDKRDGERDRRGRKKEVQLAGDAAQEFLGPLGSGTGAPGVTPPGVPLSTNGPTRNIVGKGRTKRLK